MSPLRRVHQGFAAIAAVFLLVVLAALGAYMVSFSNTQQLTSAQDMQGTRAYWAARAGLEWGIASSVAACPPAAPPFAVDAFSVTVDCTVTPYVDGDSINIFQLTATATQGAVGNVGYVERSVSASVCRLQASPFGFC